ncbi:MAG: hypothetical protein HFE04_02805 [Bacilli bacterium]|nr:hypothetical protein [Bacilli bacterium]
MKETFNKFLNLSKNTRLLAIIGIASLSICIFFTYIKYTVLGLAVKIKLIDYFEGKIIILLTILNCMFIFKDYIKKYLPKLFENDLGKKIENIKDQRWTLIPIAFTIIFAIVVKSESKTEYLDTTFGLGFYLMWLGVISLVAYAFIYKNEKIKTIDVTPKEPTNNTTKPTIQGVQMNNNVQQEAATSEVEEQKIEHKFCINCGTKCEISSTKCPACGKNF